MRKQLQASFALLRGQMNDWLHSPRTILMGVFILLLTYVFANAYKGMLQSAQLSAHIGETVYRYLTAGFGNVSLTSAMFLIMLSEIPRRTAFQNAMLIRTSRLKWLRSQILFLFVAVTLMLVLMLVLSMALTLPYLTPGSGWSDLERMAADPDAARQGQLVPDYIYVISPLQAGFYAGVILFAFWFTMVQIILLFSIAGKPNFGLMLYMFLLVLDVTVMWERIPGFVSPANFATLSSVAGMFPEKELQAVPFVLMGYGIVVLILFGLLHVQVRSMDMRFVEKDGCK